MRKRRDPLILAGVDKAMAEYRKVNHYSRLMDQAISGNPDPKTDEEVKDKGWEIIKSYFLEDMYNDISRYSDLIGSDKQTDNLSQIVEGAYYGKVDSLFVTIGEQSWGWFDQEKDAAAIKTLAQGGNVYALEKEDMPQTSTVAAIFRY